MRHYAIVVTLILVALATARVEQLRAEPYDENVRLVRVTWYLPTGNPTASGRWPEPGATASCPVEIELGRWVMVADMLRRCDDRGRGVHGARVDIFVANRAEGEALTARIGDWAEMMEVE